MRILITGMEGFAGSHLAEYALRQGAQVFGTVYPGSRQDNLAGILVAGLHPLDVTDAGGVQRLVQEIRPEWIFHLAAQSNPAVSLRDPETTLRVNILGNLRILQAAAALKTARVLIVGSADEYGRGLRSGRIRESDPLCPQTPYAVSKVCQDMMGQAFFRQSGLSVVRVRPFNHIGPRQAPGFVAADFASQVAAIEKGLRSPVLETGNLDVVRDFTDVRDIAAGYWSLLERGHAGEVYNLGSGKGIRVRALLDGLLALSRVPIRVRVRKDKIRAEQRFKVASVARVRRHTGWAPCIPLAQTLADILNDWRSRAS